MKTGNGKRLKVLVSAYACEPGKGSEPEVGWQWVRQIARFHDTWVITRANNRGSIEAALGSANLLNPRFAYVDLPNWLKFWKRGPRGVQLYYYIWQAALVTIALRLHKRIKFDICHHVSFVSDWKPPGISLIPAKFVWGPMGSHPFVPDAFYRCIGLKSRIHNLARHYLRKTARFRDPLLRYAFSKAEKIIAINGEVFRRLPVSARKKTVIIPQNGVNYKMLAPSPRHFYEKTGMSVISVGRLEYFKGYVQAIEAFSRHSRLNKNSRLTIVGDGPLAKELKYRVENLGMQNVVDFTGWTPRSEVFKRMESSDLFLFPSFEGAGMVVLEAMAKGLPVVCLDFGGPGEYVTSECGIKVPLTTPEKVIDGLADALDHLASEPELYERLSRGAIERVKQHYLWDRIGEKVDRIYSEVSNIQ